MILSGAIVRGVGGWDSGHWFPDLGPTPGLPLAPSLARGKHPFFMRTPVAHALVPASPPPLTAAIARSVSSGALFRLSV